MKMNGYAPEARQFALYLNGSLIPRDSWVAADEEAGTATLIEHDCRTGHPVFVRVEGRPGATFSTLEVRGHVELRREGAVSISSAAMADLGEPDPPEGLTRA